MLLGAHVSISGGYPNAAIEAHRLGIDAIQVFSKNQRVWAEKTVSPEEGLAFRKACVQYGVKQAFSHAIYLISLGSENEEIAQRSMLSLAMELERCRVLGLSHTVLHPGAAGSQPMPVAIERIGDRIKKVLQATKGNPVKIVLENTAGQGSSVGGKIENIAALVDHIKSKRIGICIDTCHAFAAGYDIRDKKGIDNFFKEIDQRIGLEKLLCFHLNDSKGGLGSRLDRHAHIGEGLLGLAPFEYIMKNFPHVPKVLETSKENDADKKNIRLLRELAGKKRKTK
ncbi:MAG: nfo [Bacteroidetes bacterium]|nr:nfo [Bacteroidota bacterium]